MSQFDFLRELPDGKLTQREVAILLDEIDRLGDRLDALGTLIRMIADPAANWTDDVLRLHVEHLARLVLTPEPS